MVGITHAQGDQQRHAAAVALMGIVMGMKFKAAPGLRTKPVASTGTSSDRRGARGRFVQQFLSARKAGVITQKKELMFYIRGVPTQHGGLRRRGGVSGLVGAYSYARPKPALQGVFDSLEDS